MIDRITVTNIKTNETIEINKDGSSVFVLDSIDWDAPSVESETYRVPFQIGETQAGVIIGTRKPTITGYIISNDFNNLGMTWEQYINTQKQNIEQIKKELNKAISIFQGVRIQVDDYYLDAIPTEPVRYSVKETENNEVLCFFTINLECFERPLFYKETKSVELASIEGKFIFPLVIPTNGIILGEIKRRSTVEIVNDGEAPTGCKIMIYAHGGNVVNPSVYNVSTGESLEFVGLEMLDGDYITITTETKEENAILHISRESRDVSVIGNLKDGSKFFKIEQGSNYYSYNTEQETTNNVEVSIEFEEKYFNIEGM